MNRIFRMRRWNKKSQNFDALFPQTVAANVLRHDDGGVLEQYLRIYDRHVQDEVPHINHAVSTGDHRHLRVQKDGHVLVDGYSLILTLHTNLEVEPLLDFNGTGEKPIINGAGDRIAGGQTAGAALFLVWNRELDSWISLSQDGFGAMTKIMVPMVNEYVYEARADDERLITIPGFNSREQLLTLNYGQTILALGKDYTYVHNYPSCIELKDFGLMAGDRLYCYVTQYEAVTQRGNLRYELESTTHQVTADQDEQTEFVLPVRAQKANFLEVNYNQTVLNPGIDYTVNDEGNRITLLTFYLMAGEVLSFRAIHLVESNGDVAPHPWGTTGNYRYSYKVAYAEYTSTRNGTILIPVPNYNRKRDELMVIRDNKVLVYDVDYYVDELDQVVLLNSVLDEGETLYFTLRQGSMVDTPNFNVVNAKGSSGQHLLVDITHNQLCNFYTLLVQLHRDLETAPTIKCIDGPAIPVVDCFGLPIPGGFRAGSFLWVVYNEDQHTWYSISHGQYDVSGHYRQNEENEGIASFIGPVPATVGDEGELGEVVIPHGLSSVPGNIQIIPIEPPALNADGTRQTIGDIWTHADETNIYVGNTGTATSRFRWIAMTTSANTDFKRTLADAVEELKNRPGNLFTRTVIFQATEENTREILLRDYDFTEDQILLVNYGQTILRKGMDYILEDHGISLLNFGLEPGDILQFVIAKQPKSTQPQNPGTRYFLQDINDPNTLFELDPEKLVFMDNETGEVLPFSAADIVVPDGQ